MYRSVVVFVCIYSATLFAQSSPNPAPDPATVISQIAASFSSAPIQTVQLTGTAQAYAGSDQPAGTFSYQIKSTGERTLRLDIGDLSRTDITGTFGDFTACKRIDASGVSHTVADHNCALPLDWVLPVVGLQLQAAKLSASVAEVTDVTGASLQKLTLQRPVKEGSKFAIQMAKHLTDMEFQVDPVSMSLKSISFTEHPEQDASTDFPVEIRYSDYRDINGVKLPFHVQKYVRGGLTLDLQAENATIQ